MQRLATSLLSCSLTLISTTKLLAQAAPQLGVQSGIQTGVQTGIQTGIQPSPASPGARQPRHTFIPIPMPVITPGQMELIKLESEFSQAVAKEGGKAFSSWFADDAVTLSNGKPAVLGLRAIANTAQWDPKTYQLAWYAEGAQMGPSNDTGFTWGHYDATTTAPDGKSSTTSGRYFTFWKKVNGKWKVALDASADEPPAPLGTSGTMALPAATPPR